jgi:hypothetical protein
MDDKSDDEEAEGLKKSRAGGSTAAHTSSREFCDRFPWLLFIN